VFRTKTTMPRVTVVLPALRPELPISPTLRSVLRQSWIDFEVLLVHAHGETRGPAECDELADRRVRQLTASGEGVASARNAGIRAARGALIAFIDAGDLWHPEKLARHVAHLATRPQVGVSYSQSAFIDPHGRSLGYLQTPQLQRVRAHDVFLRNPVGNGSAAVVRRQTFDQIVQPAANSAAGLPWYFDETLRPSDDVECWTRIALTTHWRFEGIGRPLTLFRVGAEGLPQALERQLASWEQVVQRIEAYAPFFVRRWAPVARAYQLRYLARRALREGRTAAAWELLAQALWQHPGLLVSDAPRTLSTLGAALLQASLTEGLYARAEAWAMRCATRLSPRVRGG
jgi:glycosyltransferase involved in cell wall biosynthesis